MAIKTKDTKNNKVTMYTHEEAIKDSLEYFNGDNLAASVFVSKYAMRDENGIILEPTPNEMHRRLAKEFARIEQNYDNPLSEEEIYNYFKDFQWIIPQGSPMSAIGNDYQIQSCSNCFVAGTRVFTTSGIKNIEDIVVGDKVITHTGNVRNVLQVHKNALNGRQVVNLKCFRTPDIQVTENHKFYSISEEQMKWGESPQWNSVAYLREGDFVAIPNVKLSEKQHDFNCNSFDIYAGISEYLQSNNLHEKYEINKEEDNIDLSYVYTSGRNAVICKKKHRAIKSTWHVDEDFAYFLGLWFGDGCVFSSNSTHKNHGMISGAQRNRKASNHTAPRGITFTFGSHESKIIEFVSVYGQKLLGIKPDINNFENVNGTCQIVFASAAVGMAFEQFFGRKFDGKKINQSIFAWDYSLIKALTQGFIDSDGTITKEGDIRVVMGNKSLVESLYFLLRQFGEVVGLVCGEKYSRIDFPKNSKFAFGSNKTYNDTRINDALNKGESKFHIIEIDGTKFVKINSKTKTDLSPEFVYTLGVEEDHSYCVEGVMAQNCFVIPSPEDSYGGILKTDQEQAQIMKRRGGVGFDISHIRPKGIITKNAARTTDGIGVFMERFSNTCREVAQNGRRGALMLTISCHHPEIRTFINIKKDKTKVTGANISIRLSDEFMNAVKNKSKVELRWPVNSSNPKVRQEVNAVELWKEIIQAAWESAEPGLLFWDTAQKYTPSDIYKDFGFASTATNPCAEIVLSPFDSCRLMCVNLLSFVEDKFTNNAKFDYKKLEQIAEIAQRLMDDMIDIELEQIDKILNKIDCDPESAEVKLVEKELWQNIRKACIEGRRTGLGITALGDAIASLNVRYGSKESIEITELIYKSLAIGSYRSSCKMARDRGAFPIFSHDLERNHPYLQRIWDAAPDVFELYKKYGRRNIANLTTAPTGSVSTVTQTTSGIEPAYLVFYKRRKKINPGDGQNARVDFVDQNGDKWQEFPVFHHQFKEWMDVNGYQIPDDQIKNISTADDLEFYKKSPYYKATSNDVDWAASVDLQGVAQKWVDHAISKTCNLPNDATQEVVAEVYMKAWEAGCKGFTVYRDGCRTGVLVANTVHKKDSLTKTNAPKRPKTLDCEIHHIKARGEDFFVLVSMFEGHPYEVFAGKNGCITTLKKGTITKNKRGHYELQAEDGSKVENVCDLLTDEQAVITRMISLALRHGSDISFIVDQLEKSPGDMTNFGKAMARVLKKYIPDGTKATGAACETCGGSNVVRMEGCLSCKDCGGSKCG